MPRRRQGEPGLQGCRELTLALANLSNGTIAGVQGCRELTLANLSNGTVSTKVVVLVEY